MTESTRDIAARLAALPDKALADLFVARGAAVNARWRDFFDVAEALTSDASIAQALATLPADDIAALMRGERSDRADAMLLTDAAGVPLPATATLLTAVGVASAPFAREPAPPSGESASAAAAERAFTSLDTLGDIVLDALHTPLTILASGTLAAAERRRLAEGTQRPDDLDALITLAQAAGLLVGEDRTLVATAAGEMWLREPTPQRWMRVARAFTTLLPAAVRAVQGWTSPATWLLAYPADPDWPDRAQSLRMRGIAWGVFAADDTQPAWTRALAEDDATAAAALTAALPHEVDRIYLQNDLTAISPGPLAAALDVRLRGIARRESHAQASTYRFTAETVATSLSEGETAESIIEFLALISLTGVPQPLDYLVRTTAERHGSVRVSRDPDAPAEAPRTRIESDEAAVLATLAVDQSLRPLGLVESPDGAALHSRVDRDAVLWSLVDAKYPAVAVDAAGNVEPLRRHRLAGAPPVSVDPLTAYAPLLARLRETDGVDVESAWLERELDAAVRSRATIDIELELPGGERRVFTLEATGLGGGRLRGRERGTDIERTVPVSSIRSLRPAPGR